jgi:release factor glutamine methyltransferase
MKTNGTISRVLQDSRQILQVAGVLSADLDAQILVSFVLKKDKTFLLSQPDFEVGQKEEKKIQELIERRAEGEPVAYLVGEKEFYGLAFKVNKTVLVPRPETEIMVEEVLGLIQKETGKINLIDLGTGSGCIVTAVLKNLEEKNLGKIKKSLAVDICKRALMVARFNFDKHGLSNQVEIRQSDLLANIKKNEMDNAIIMANLPYVPQEWQVGAGEKPETRGLSYEPAKALYAGYEGLEFYIRLFREIKEKN